MELTSELNAIFQVIFINVALSGDNAVVVAMAAAGAPVAIRQKVIFYGIAGAVVLRIGLALLATQFLDVIGLLFAGGLLLLWVCWNLFREIRKGNEQRRAAEMLEHPGDNVAPNKTLGQALRQIIIADVSMSLDNVLAVAGAAHEHPWIMAAGLLLSVVLMGLGATVIARLLERWRWLAWIGLLVIVYVALEMVWEGGWQLWEKVGMVAT